MVSVGLELLMSFGNVNRPQILRLLSAQLVYGGEVEFRSALESEISNQGWKELPEGQKNSAKKIPIVVLVVGGGPRTVEQILKSVENGSPCVILEVSDSL